MSKRLFQFTVINADDTPKQDICGDAQEMKKHVPDGMMPYITYCERDFDLPLKIQILYGLSEITIKTINGQTYA